MRRAGKEGRREAWGGGCSAPVKPLAPVRPVRPLAPVCPVRPLAPVFPIRPAEGELSSGIVSLESAELKASASVRQRVDHTCEAARPGLSCESCTGKAGIRASLCKVVRAKG